MDSVELHVRAIPAQQLVRKITLVSLRHSGEQLACDAQELADLPDPHWTISDTLCYLFLERLKT